MKKLLMAISLVHTPMVADLELSESWKALPQRRTGRSAFGFWFKTAHWVWCCQMSNVFSCGDVAYAYTHIYIYRERDLHMHRNTLKHTYKSFRTMHFYQHVDISLTIWVTGRLFTHYVLTYELCIYVYIHISYASLPVSQFTVPVRPRQRGQWSFHWPWLHDWMMMSWQTN